MILTNLPFFTGMNGLGNQLIPSTQLLCRLAVGPQMRNNNIELHIDDLRLHDWLDDTSKKLEAVMKFFTKWGKARQHRRQRLWWIQRTTTSYILAEILDYLLHEPPRGALAVYLCQFGGILSPAEATLPVWTNWRKFLRLVRNPDKIGLKQPNSVRTRSAFC